MNINTISVEIQQTFLLTRIQWTPVVTTVFVPNIIAIKWSCCCVLECADVGVSLSCTVKENRSTRGKPSTMGGWPLTCHMPSPGIELGPQRWKARDIPLRYPGPLQIVILPSERESILKGEKLIPRGSTLKGKNVLPLGFSSTPFHNGFIVLGKRKGPKSYFSPKNGGNVPDIPKQGSFWNREQLKTENTTNTLYNDTRYKDKNRYYDNSTDMKPSLKRW